MTLADKGELPSVSRLFAASGMHGRPAYELAAVAGGLLAGQPAPAIGEPAAEAAAGLGATREGEPLRPVGGLSKRIADIAIALVALILAAPVMLAVAGLIRLTTRGPALFAHRRVGYRGTPFYCYKFRTMVPDAEAALAAHLARDPDAAREWSETRKLRRDPRITTLGHLLRKSSLDELPQLINILRGDMSCVGPRPVVTEELERYGPFVDDYLSARPGLTGLWQVTGRSSTDFASRVSLDSHYVRHWSLIADVVILARTTVAVMRLDEVC
jgi:exopolysaccharide production protein ExoY